VLAVSCAKFALKLLSAIACTVPACSTDNTPCSYGVETVAQAQRAGAFFALAAKCLPVPAVVSSSTSLCYAAVAPALSTSTAAPTPTAAAAAAAGTTSNNSNPTDSSTAAAIAAAVAAVRDAPLSSDVAAALLHSPAAAGNTASDTTNAATAAVAAVAEGQWRCIVCTRVSAYPDWYDPAKGGRPELRMVVKQGEVDAKKLRAQFTPILSTPKVSASTSSYCCCPVNRPLSILALAAQCCLQAVPQVFTHANSSTLVKLL
jgi:hypothetical protein